jgi:anti-anti-sigma factor
LPSIHEPTVEVRSPRPDAAQVVVGGEHDLASAPALEQALDRCLGVRTHLIVDLSTTEYIDSSVIAVLLRAKRRADELGHGFNLVLGTTPVVDRVLELSGVLPSLNPVATVDDALTG